ncbi:SDR family NAD(P)-dependent oxidoreductase, partial [Mycobacterium tuberculosis]|nr:SDR family NAD(P)-dependent oxidoreductase [Mycobacterium tuberculosis]
AGVLTEGKLADISPDAVRRQIDIDALGVTLGAQAAHKYLKKTPGAHLVNIASASAIYGQPGIATYSASKFYVAGLTEALELEWEPDDIRVVSIWPLWAKT